MGNRSQRCNLCNCVVATCGCNVDTSRPAAGPWNYDMSAAPEMYDLLAILRTPDQQETYITRVVMMASGSAYWAHDGEATGCLPIAWAAINIPAEGK